MRTHQDSATEGTAFGKRHKESDLIVDLKFLNHSQLHEHSQSSCYHGVDVQGEIVEGELVDAQLADEGDVSGLFRGCGRKYWGGEGETSESRRGWRGQGMLCHF